MASEPKLRRRCFGGQRNEDFESNVHILHVDACCLPLTASFRREAESSRLPSGWSPPLGDLSLMRGHVGHKNLPFWHLEIGSGDGACGTRGGECVY